VGDVEGAPAIAKALQMLKRPAGDTMGALLEKTIYDPAWHVTGGWGAGPGT
jgi:hypothetical protein